MQSGQCTFPRQDWRQVGVVLQVGWQYPSRQTYPNHIYPQKMVDMSGAWTNLTVKYFKIALIDERGMVNKVLGQFIGVHC